MVERVNSERDLPVLTRDDPEKEPLVGHVKVTREDWLNVARDVLVHDGVSEVKILTMADRLEVSRSSFYWYFRNREHLLEMLLEEWERKNTATIVEQCGLPSDNITEAVCNFFRCFVFHGRFDPGLDFAVREWSRRDPNIRDLVNKADAKRLAAVAAMFVRHEYSQADSDIRSRILYFQQLGYHALEISESMDVRMGRLDGYIEGFTGRPVSPDASEAFKHSVKVELD